MNPRHHYLARMVVARIQLGHDPYESALRGIAAATQSDPWPHLLDLLPRRSRDVCMALWSEPPMRAVDVHRVIGGSYHSIHQLLLRLVVARIVRRTGYGRYQLARDEQMPTALPKLSRLRVRAA